MTTASTPTMTAHYTTVDGSLIVVHADRGVEAHGRLTGNPLGIPEYGSVTVTISGADGGVARLRFDSEDDLENFLGLVGRANRIANSYIPQES